MKVLTLKPVRLNGKDEPEGKVLEIPDDLARIWCNPPWNLATMELLKPKESPESESKDEQTENEYPKPLGGGYYLLPDGSKVRGKDEALKAMTKFGGD